MKSMLRLLVALLLVGGWSLAALALHVIIAPGAGGGSLPVRIIVLPKDHLGVAETYVDTQHWTIDDVSKRRLGSSPLPAREDEQADRRWERTRRSAADGALRGEETGTADGTERTGILPRRCRAGSYSRERTRRARRSVSP